MKPLTYSLIAAALACGLASATTTAYTTPVGYVTETLAPSQYNLIGMPLQTPTTFAGLITGKAANTVSFTGVDLTVTLGASGSSGTYVLELPNGIIQEVTAWTATSITTPQDISSYVVANTTTAVVRKAPTVAQIFGATNSSGLSATTDISTADKIWIPDGMGGWSQVFYYNDGAGTEGWLDDQNNLAADRPLFYADALYVQRVAGSSISLTISGEVKKTPTSSALIPAWNFLGAVSPAGLTLANSGLENSISHGTDPASCDNVWFQLPGGTYQVCFFYDDGAGTTGWLDQDNNIVNDLPFQPGFLIYNRGAGKQLTVGVPSFYTTL